jgi:hypothetical protein
MTWAGVILASVGLLRVDPHLTVYDAITIHAPSLDARARPRFFLLNSRPFHDIKKDL